MSKKSKAHKKMHGAPVIGKRHHTPGSTHVSSMVPELGSNTKSAEVGESMSRHKGHMDGFWKATGG